MLGILARMAWRLMVAAVAVGVAYCTVWLLFPYLDHHVPLAAVLIILYLFIAYFVIPGLVRLWQIVIRPTHLPLYATSRDGWPSDPVNLVFVVRNRHALIAAFTKAGWTQADPSTPWRTLREGWAILWGTPYPTAPFSKLYLMGRAHDIGFQIQPGHRPSPRHRHHIRVWRLDTTRPHVHTNFWQRTLTALFHPQRELWVAAATHDISPFAIRMQTLQITHKIDADTQKERDYVIVSLNAARLIRRRSQVTTGDPLRFHGQTFGTTITVDGTLDVLEL